MAFKFNPFSGTLDQTGSGGGASYIDGEVQNFSALPETIGTPAVDSAYLVREAEGTWLLARKPAGIYIRTANTGTRADDWTHASAFPDVFSDAAFTVYSDGDSTKNLQLSLSGITTGTTRTLTAADASGVIALAATRTVVSYSTDQSLPATRNTLLVVSNTNAAGINLNLPTTDTNDGDTYTFIGGSSLLGPVVIRKAVLLSPSVFAEQARITVDGQCHTFRAIGNGSNNWELVSANWSRPPSIGNYQPNTGAFTTLNATGTTELVNGGTTAGPFRIYNTFTDATNFERLNLRWASNVAIIGTEKGGTGGSARALEFQTDGVTRMTIASSGGTINVGSGAQFGSNGIQVASTASLRFSGGAIGSSSDLWMLRSGSGIIRFATGSSTSTADFNRLQFGGTTSSFPALKRDTTTLQVKLADDSAFTAIAASNLVLTDNTGAETAIFDAQAKLTDNRTYDLPDASGTIALTSQISKTYAVFTATDNQPPASAFATLDTRNSIAVLDFDDATDESAVFVSIIPEAASLGSGLKIRLHWMATTATSGDVVWDVSLERMTTDLDSDSFDTIASGTAAANGTSGILTVTEITLTTIDSVTAGDGYRLKVTRDANNASDTMTGDAELVVCEVRSAA
jgi:hypothetical protein